MGDLDKLLDNYEQRKQQEHEASEKKEAQEQELRTKAINTFTTAVLPVLRELSTAIQQKGHKSSITGHLGSSVSPSVELSFTPITDDKSTYRSPSTLRFRANGEQFVLDEDIMDKQGGNRHSSPAAVIALSDITEDWTRSQILAFIEAV